MEIRFFGLWFGVKQRGGELLHSPLPSEFEVVANDLAPKMERLRDIIVFAFIAFLLIIIGVIARLKGIL